jgi:hypothetical protein
MTPGASSRMSTTDGASNKSKQSKNIYDNVNWASPMGGNDTDDESPMGSSYKFHDPYDIFKKVFKDEFGEEFVPGNKTTTSAATPNRNKHSRALVTTTKKKKGAEDFDNRVISMKMTSKQVMHDDGRIETVTTTIFTRPNGETERVTKSSFDNEKTATNKKQAPAKRGVEKKAPPKKHEPVVEKKKPPKKHEPKSATPPPRCRHRRRRLKKHRKKWKTPIRRFVLPVQKELRNNPKKACWQSAMCA